MAAISPNLIAYYAMKAGLRGNAVIIATAIALAESSGNTTAIHVNSNNSTDYGLWQINSVHSQYDPRLLLTPDYNASAMYAISSRGSNWYPWTSYKTGTYKQYLAIAQYGYVGQAGGAGKVPVGTTTPTDRTPTNPTLTVDQVFSSKGLWKWYSSKVTNPFNGTSERGADYSTTWGTPVGCIIGGKVVRIEHNNNSIGDIVEVLTGSGDVVLYQHIRKKVSPGQLVSTGDVIGTEDGMPVDQYSTGPHIECRYAPKSLYVFSQGSWNNGWVNPVPIFSRIGSAQATGPGVSLDPISGLPGGAGLSLTSTLAPMKTFTPLLEQVHETLINTPGFYGIALAVDEAEQFPGWIDLTQQTDVQILGADIPMPDITGTVRSAGASLADNFLPFAIRSGLVLFGAFLMIALVVKPIESNVQALAPLIKAVA